MVYAKREIGPTMNAHEFINYELKFNLSDHYILVERGNYRYA